MKIKQLSDLSKSHETRKLLLLNHVKVFLNSFIWKYGIMLRLDLVYLVLKQPMNSIYGTRPCFPNNLSGNI